MRVFIYILQPVDGVVGIHLCGGKAAVAQQFLYGVNVGAVVRKVRGKGMAQDVRAALFDGGYQA